MGKEKVPNGVEKLPKFLSSE